MVCSTFVKSVNADVFDAYDIFCKPAIKLGKTVRASGGLVCLIRKCFSKFVKYMEFDNTNFCSFVIDKRLFGTMKDILYICVYVPPEGSPYYVHFDKDNGINSIEESLSKCLLALDDVYVLLCGDLNSRTADVSQTYNHEVSSINEQYKSFSPKVGRLSQDSVLNKFGKLLLDLCTAFGLSILNGVCKGDLQGRYTYIGETGCSVVDYFLISHELYSLLCDACELTVCEQIFSDHLPVVLKLHLYNKNVFCADTIDNELTIEKYVFRTDSAQRYQCLMSNVESQSLINAAMNMVDADIDNALEIFNGCIKKNADFMKKIICVSKRKYDAEWFDKECVEFRKSVRKYLRK